MKHEDTSAVENGRDGMNHDTQLLNGLAELTSKGGWAAVVALFLWTQKASLGKVLGAWAYRLRAKRKE